MSFATQVASDLAAPFNVSESAQNVTYNGTAIAAQVSFQESFLEQAGIVVKQAKLWIKVSNVANPTYRDTVVIGSDTWRVRQIEAGNAYVWRIICELDERPVL